MSDENTPRRALVEEVGRLRRRVEELEQLGGEVDQAQEDLRRRVEHHTHQYSSSLEEAIAQRRRAEARLEDSEARFHRIFDLSNDAILLLDLDLNELVDANPRACGLLEYTREELLGMPVSVVFRGDITPLQAFALSVVDDGHGWVEELRCLTRTGRALTVELSASVIEIEERSCLIAHMRDVTRRQQAQAEILSSLHEKEVLLREIHHRVKNNLQIVTSLLDLQAGQVGGEATRQRFEECRNRVRSIALIHEQLYRGHDQTGLDVREYLKLLTEQVLRAHGVAGNRIGLELKVGVTHLDVDTAVPCGLIVNELMTNALKYAFPDGRTGRIAVSLDREGGEVLRLTVGDDGVGFPDDVDFRASPSLGLRLVDSLVTQLRGRLDLEPANGSLFTVTFPAPAG